MLTSSGISFAEGIYKPGDILIVNGPSWTKKYALLLIVGDEGITFRYLLLHEVIFYKIKSLVIAVYRKLLYPINTGFKVYR
jgi:hypothetical protein